MPRDVEDGASQKGSRLLSKYAIKKNISIACQELDNEEIREMGLAKSLGI